MSSAGPEAMPGFDGTVVVPSAAVARLLRAEVDAQACAQGRRAWRMPDVLPWLAWLERGFEFAALGEEAGTGAATFVLSGEQERALWEAVVADDTKGAPGAADEAARLAQEAWRTLHEWSLPADAVLDGPASEDVLAFRRWRVAYLERTAALGATDRARLAARAVPPPGRACAHGFVDVPPALERAFEQAGVARALPAEDAPLPEVRCHADREAELRAAAHWAAREVAADVKACVVVAVEGLARHEDLARACFAEGLGEAAHELVFGSEEPLDRAPAVRAALDLLDVRPVMTWDALGALLLGAHTRGATAERDARASFDATLRAFGRYEMPLSWVSNLLAAAERPCPEFARLLPALADVIEQAPARQRLTGWAAHFQACLDAAGWPGDGLVPEAVRSRWDEALDRLQRLDTVLAPVPRGEALARLRRVVADTPLPGASTGGRVFVVTPTQAAALQPTALWLAGCTSDAFSAAAAPSPLLPFDVQRDACVPGAWANRDLHRARRLLAALGARGTACVASWPAADGDVRLAPSPLVPGLRDAPPPDGERLLPESWRRARAAARFETLADLQGTPLAGDAPRVSGGVAVLAAQAACPFRAYARHRLGAEAPEEPRPGVDARHKGIAVHRALATVWSRLGSQDALSALGAEARADLLRDAVRAAFSPLPFETPVERALFFVERERLERLIDVWLEYEFVRAPFTVIAAERSETVRFGGLAFSVRVDRIDRLEDGAQLLVDYKTGRCAQKDWDVPRMDEPQLPFYALAIAGERAAGVAFARLRTGDYAWVAAPRGVERGEADDGEAWVAQCAAWQADLEALCDGVVHGDARPDPKHGEQTCRRCDQHLLCRIAEIARTGENADEDDA